jgi:hypothetical protein
MVSINRLLYAALGLVGCLVGFEVGQSYLESPKAGSGDNSGLVRSGDPPMECRLHVLLLRNRAKGRVIEQLAVGRIDLFEAAAWFRYLNATPPDCPGEPIDDWPEACPEEKLCRQVIAHVRIEQGRIGAHSAALELTAQLERDLADALSRYGGLELPSLGP